MFEFFKSGKDGNGDKETIRIALENEEQWKSILELSNEHVVFIFKHSSRCGISSVVLNRFEKQIKERGATYYYLHIQAFRNLSNWLADELNIRHESPQLIVIKNENVLAHDSHYALLEIIPNM